MAQPQSQTRPGAESMAMEDNQPSQLAPGEWMAGIEDYNVRQEKRLVGCVSSEPA